MRTNDRVDDRQPETGPAADASTRRVGSGEALEHVSGCLGRDAAPLVGDLDLDDAVVPRRAQLDRIGRLGVLDGVLEQGVEDDPQALPIGCHGARVDMTEPPDAGADLGPAYEDILEEGFEIELLPNAEVRKIRLREQEQPLDDLVHPLELVHGDDDFLRSVPVGAKSEIEVATGDSHRRPQFVGGVIHELLPPRHQLGVLLGAQLGRAQRVLAPTGMPDHGEEHRGHQRHLEELAPKLDPVEGVHEDQSTRAGDHGRENDPRSVATPDAEAVNQGQADPYEVERDRLPVGPEAHCDEVGGRERSPRQLDRSTPQ